MSRRIVRILVVAGMLICGCARTPTTQNSSRVQEQLNAFAEALLNGTMGAIEALNIPVAAETPIRVSPEGIEEGWHYKTIIRDTSVLSSEKVATALRTASIQEDDSGADLRQAIVFYSRENEMRIGALYFDGTGRHGFVNDIPVLFERGFCSRLMDTLTSSLE